MTITPFKLERYFSEHEFTAKYLLCSSDPESMSIGELLAFEPGASEGLGQTWLGYTEYPGVGHGSWLPAYDEPELWPWMFSHRLGDAKKKG